MHHITRYARFVMFLIVPLMGHGAFAADLDAGDFHACAWRGSEARCWGARQW